MRLGTSRAMTLPGKKRVDTMGVDRKKGISEKKKEEEERKDKNVPFEQGPQKTGFLFNAGKRRR